MPGGFYAAHGPAKLDVHEHDVRWMLSDQIHRSLGSVDGRQQPDAGIVPDHAGECVGEQAMIVTDQQLDLILGEFVHRSLPPGQSRPPAPSIITSHEVSAKSPLD